MKYYSEATVNGIIHDMYQGNHIPKATDYPSIEIPEPHGRIIDENDLHIKDTDGLLEAGTVWDAPTILEASK